MNATNNVMRQQIEKLLAQLGFDENICADGAAIFHHPAAGTTILLPANRRNQPVRTSDLVSIGRHLTGRGHLEEAAFAAFLESGELPESVHT